MTSPSYEGTAFLQAFKSETCEFTAARNTFIIKYVAVEKNTRGDFNGVCGEIQFLLQWA